MLLQSLRRLSYRITNPRIVHTPKTFLKDQTLPFYPVVGLKEVKTGAMLLNKPDNNNNVTEQCADELYRFFSSYHHDHTVENVWIQSRGSAFSGGADYEELLTNPHYFDKLMKLAVFIGQFNKPVFAKVNGSVRGISSYILTMFSTPMGTERSSLRLDETSRGFVPIFGGSHRLSRMVGFTGMYLALTGDKLDAGEMAKLGFLKAMIRDEMTNKQVRKHLSDANLFMRNPYTENAFSPSENRRERKMLFKMNYFYDLVSETQKDIFASDGNFNSKLAMNQYRIAQTQYYNTLHPYTSQSQKRGLFVHNYFEMRHDRPFRYLKQKQIVEEARTDQQVLHRLPLHKIIKVFDRKSIQQVIGQLKKDGSQWAQNTLATLRSKDPLSVHLTFQLIKRAKQISWVECLELEYLVAKRLLSISKIKQVESQNGSSVKVLYTEHSNKKLQQISPELVNWFFRPHENDNELLDHDTPHHSLLPTSDYWKKVPDAGRNYLNRTFFEDRHALYGDTEVRRFLNQYKIDYRDRSYNIPDLREAIHRQLNYENLVEVERQRLRSILNSEVFYRQLKEERTKYADSQIESKQFPKLIEQQIKRYFELKFNTRFDDMKPTAEIAGKQNRMNILKDYVAVITENIVMNGDEIQQRRSQQNVKHNGIVRFDKSGTDIFHAETEHQKTLKPLKTLKQAYKTGDRKLLQNIDPETPMYDFMFEKGEVNDYEHEIIKQDAALRLNYNTTIIPREQAVKYRFLIERVSKTSEQIAGLMSWQDSDIENVIINAPKRQIKFREFAQKIMDQKEQANNKVEHYNELYNNLVRLLKSNKEQAEDEQTAINHLLFDVEQIPIQFRNAHLELLQQVIQFFSQKYQIEGLISSHKSQPNIISKWTEKGINQSFTKLLKNDVEYVFSYLGVLQMKDILNEIRREKTRDIKRIQQILSIRFNIQISGLNESKFNSVFMKYLYKLLDIHEESKHKIIFPQTKMIEFLNRLKADSQNTWRTSQVSYESMMMMIGRDRKMIRDQQEGIIPLLGYDPETSLNEITDLQKKNNTGFPLFQDIVSNKYVQTNDPRTFPYYKLKNHVYNSSSKEGSKKLVSAFNHYLRRFQSILQSSAGSTMFLPKYLHQCQAKKDYEHMRSIIDVTLTKQQWFVTKLRSAINNLFEFRLQNEKKMQQGELQAFDQDFSEFFSPDMMALIIRYELLTEETIAKNLIAQEKQQKVEVDLNKSKYLQVKSQIKNPRALRVFNNLMMSQNVVNDRLSEMTITNYRKKSIKEESLPTSEERQELDLKKGQQLNIRTLRRLGQQATRLADDYSNVSPKNTRQVRNALSFNDHLSKNTSDFMDELKIIEGMLDDADLKAEIQDRISRVEKVEKSKAFF